MIEDTTTPQSDVGQSSLTLRSLLAALTELEDVDELTDLEMITLPAGEVLFNQGDPGNSMYVLMAGVLGVRVRHEDGSETVIDKLASGTLVGEMAMISGRPRTATVFALVDCGLIRISRREFEELQTREEITSSEIAEALAPRWQRLQLAYVLRELFGELDTSMLHALQNRLEWRHLSNGDVLFEQGQDPDGMYIVVNGRLRATLKTPEGESRVLNEIGSGETVGEYALITADKRTATIMAVRETDVVRLLPKDFESLISQYPNLLITITRIIIERHVRQLKIPAQRSRTSYNFTIVQLNSKLDPMALAAELAEKLNAYGQTLYLTASQFDEMYGQQGAAQLPLGDASNPAVVAWLAEQEGRFRHIIYVCDPDYSNWTRRCLSQADRVLLLANAEGEADLLQVETELGRMKAELRTDLILLHAPDIVGPHNTAKWLDGRSITQWYHLRQGNRSDIERLARLLTGNGVALVLSGGGARGFAHLGVIRALEELETPIDYLGGASMGAMVAAFFASGRNHEQAMAYAKNKFAADGWSDYTLPLTSLMSSKRVTTTIQDICGETAIEDLWLPYFCNSTNLTTAEQMVHRRGPAWRAVRASLAIPGVFTPVIEDGEVLVDGGVMDNFPIDLMAELSQSNRIIGVFTTSYRPGKVNYSFDTDISGWRILRSRINPLEKSLRSPSLTGTIMRTLDINAIQKSREAELMASLVIKPDVRRWGFLDFSQIDGIEQAGYEAAFQTLCDWLDRSR